ncbi:MAG: hypothetical protein H0T47_06360 [Planctomycetaceae bacterium]|nr:hypothetical protein [Planctomycetaceae bacterium]
MSSTLAVQNSALLDGEVDLVEEMRLRTWARKNYVAACERDEAWHPVVTDEMLRIDEECME